MLSRNSDLPVLWEAASECWRPLARNESASQSASDGGFDMRSCQLTADDMSDASLDDWRAMGWPVASMSTVGSTGGSAIIGAAWLGKSPSMSAITSLSSWRWPWEASQAAAAE